MNTLVIYYQTTTRIHQCIKNINLEIRLINTLIFYANKFFQNLLKFRRILEELAGGMLFFNYLTYIIC